MKNALFIRYFLWTPAALLLLFCVLRFSPYRELDTFLAAPVSTRIFDRNGVLVQISALEGGMRREFIEIDALPPSVIAFFLHSEDAAFFHHAGFNPLSVARAAAQNFSGGRRVSGASTITMQLARIIERRAGLARSADTGSKLRELYNALRLESRLGKRRILELYLNNVPFGSQVEGIASAARHFFSEDADMLSPTEICALAVIPRRPADYNPLENPENCWSAARLVQRRFCENPRRAAAFPLLATLNDADWQTAPARAEKFRYPYEAPHFVRFVLSRTQARAPELSLSLDLRLTRFIEAGLRAQVARFAAQRLSTGAAIVLDNQTGEVLAWVGSADFFDRAAQGQVDGVLALNQPGSSMKPFLYALALERGFPPATLLADIARDFGTDALYIPQNFNNRFNGPVLMRQALASSLNIPAVELLHRLGQKNYADFLRTLGFASLEGEGGADAAGLGLALGNAPVSLFELARAFSVFPNDGKLIEPVFCASGSASDSASSTGAPPAAIRVFSADSARLIASFLSDADARVLAFGRARNFQTEVPAIFKTGTANQYQSIVALAASRAFTVAVWMGNFSGQTIIGKTGSSVPAAIARETLNALHEGAGRGSGEAFLEPENFERAALCAVSGMSPGPACLALVREYVPKNAVLPPLCTWHVETQAENKTEVEKHSTSTVQQKIEVGKHSVSTVEKKNVEKKNVREKYPAEYQSWFLSSKRDGSIAHSEAPLSIISPRDGFIYYYNPVAPSEIPVEVVGGKESILEVEFDGMRRSVPRPFIFRLPATPGTHTLSVRCGDETAQAFFRVE
ncbi:MAG: transglycosylase domain-containing protein [Spirochaetaceae bacterium]|jgi:penicillin-binding protein 1C|nr:transglycosylase domain-containing protein [Spirochaetaceae bacterium]